MLVLTLALYVVIFALIILLHEGGHYLAAKREGMTVKEFSFGFPPRLFSITRHGTRFTWNLFPIGGYVSILGEDGSSTATGSFTRFSPWARLRVVLAGVVMNLLLAWALLTVWLWIAPLFPKVDAIAVAGVQAGSAAEAAGFKVNDFIVSADDGTVFHADTELGAFTRSHQGDTVTFSVRRNGRLLSVSATLHAGDAPLGVVLADIGNDVPQVPWWRAPVDALAEMWFAATMTLGFLGKAIVWLVSHAVSTVLGLVGLGSVAVPGSSVAVPADAVSGPVGIFAFLQQTVLLGVPFVIRFVGMMSLAVGVFNLLPIPALDGGRAVFVAYEAVFKRRVVSEQVESWVHAVGFAALILLIIVITVSDIRKLF